MQTAFIILAAEQIQQSLLQHEAEIESLDRAIGDGDHYINIKRASETIATMADELKNQPVDVVLNKIGMKLLSTIGGASGPLFASFFMAFAKVAKENGHETLLQTAAAIAAGVQAIIQRGKAGLGEKTMLDVLIPVSTNFTTLAAQDKSSKEIAIALKKMADDGLESTRNLIATKGRAAGLGERAIGHLDAGAKSCQIIIHTVCDLVLKG